MFNKSESKYAFEQSPDKMLLKYNQIKEVQLPSKEDLLLIAELKELKDIAKDISINRLTEYLEAPTIIDNFSAIDDTGRNEFEESIKNTPAGNLYKKNKLRASIMGAMGMYVQHLSRYKLLSAEESNLCNNFNQEYMHYRGLNLESKLAVIKDLDNLARRVGTRLINTYSEVEAA